MEIDRNRPFIGFVLSLLGAAFTLVTEGAHVNYILKTSPDSFAANLPA